MPETLLRARRPAAVDPASVGISYSGGGPLLLIELGVARAFVELGLRPFAIAGVSAGAIAASAHALDPVGGRGIDAAIAALAGVNNATFGLTLPQIALNAVWNREHLAALGDNAPMKGLFEGVFEQVAGQRELTVDYFGRDGRPQLIIGAADRLSAEPTWFEGSVPVADALIASSAIPGVFPAKTIPIDGTERLFVDGGVVSGQPLSILALAGCGTIYACAVGYDGEKLAPPTNLIDNWMQAFTIAIHNASRLEQDYVQLKLGDRGVIHHIHPEIPFPIDGFNFDRGPVAQVVADAVAATKEWITSNQLMPGEGGRAD